MDGLLTKETLEKYLALDEAEVYELKRRTETFIAGKEQGERYLTLLDINMIGRLYTTRDEIQKITDEHPLVFFYLSLDRFILTIWIFEAVSMLFSDENASPIPLGKIYTYLREHFSSKVLSRHRLERLFEGEVVISRKHFLRLKEAVEAIYRCIQTGSTKGFIKSLEHTLIAAEEKTPFKIIAIENHELKHYLNEVYKDDKVKNILFKRAKGATLAEISAEVEMTREGVRQVQKKAVLRTSRLINNRLGKWLEDNEVIEGNLIIEQRILKHIDKDDLKILKYLFKEADNPKICYLENLNLVFWDVSERARELLLDIDSPSEDVISIRDIEDWVNILRQEGIRAIDPDTLYKHLRKNGYSRVGNRFLKQAVTIRKAAQQVMDDLKDEVFHPTNPEDTSKMRKLISEKGANPNDNDRAFWVRVLESMVLCGKGAYCSPNRIKVEPGLLKEIASYIDNNIGEGIYYKSIFHTFEKKLLKGSNIDNHHFLHGVLMHYFPDKYGYAKDYVYPLEKDRKDIRSAQFLHDFLKDKGRPVKKIELFKEFGGITDIQINNAQAVYPDILHWDTNTFLNASVLNLQKEDIHRIKDLIEQDFRDNHGYSSAYRLLDLVILKAHDVVKRYGINNELNCFRVAEYALGDIYAFSYPHIVKEWATNKRFTTIDLLDKLSKGEDLISKTSLYKEAINAVGKQVPSINYSLRDYCFKRIRLNEDQFLRPEAFNSLEVIISHIEDRISSILKKQEVIVPALETNLLKDLPNIGYPWTSFIVGSIIDLYLPAYRVIGKTLSSAASYAFVKQESKLRTKEDVLLWLIKKNFSSDSLPGEITSYIEETQLFRKLTPQITWIEEVPTISGTFDKDDN